MAVSAALTKHYQLLLGLTTPWTITDIVMTLDEQRIDITIAWPADRRVSCPDCGRKVGRKDLREERVWRHLDTMQFQTFLHCRVPRSECPEHGVKTVSVPWAEKGSRWTLLYEAFAIEIMLQVSSLTRAAELLHLSWDEAHALRARAVRRGLAVRALEPLEYEKSFGRKERFITVLSDLTGERILEVAPSKSTESALQVLSVVPEAQRPLIAGVAMDMAAAFERACITILPQAEVIYDKFHIEKMLSEAMDTVRRKEHARLQKEGIHVFTKSRYLWLQRPERWSRRRKEQFRDIKKEYGATRFAQSKISRAWSIKEAFRVVWSYVYPGAARRSFRHWYFWATHSRLAPMIKVARTLQRHLDGILAYFRHGITNAFTEGMNSRIQEIKSAARGFRNFENYRVAILFYCGRLELKPQ